jgi:hypothetical protein
MKLKGKITILINQDETMIEIRDELSSITFLKITLTPEQLSSALSRLAMTSCKFETRGLELVGKKMEHKSFEFEIPTYITEKYNINYNMPEEELQKYAQKLLDEEGEGYIAESYFQSQGSFFSKNGIQYARVIARRWI